MVACANNSAASLQCFKAQASAQGCNAAFDHVDGVVPLCRNRVLKAITLLMSRKARI